MVEPLRLSTLARRRGTHVVPVVLATTLQLAGCSSFGPATLKPGDGVDIARQKLGLPSAEHRRPDGTLRLEYATGPFGKRTYMLDFDAQGRLTGWENVLDEAHFSRIAAGISQGELRQKLGMPSKVWQVRYHDQTVWSYRFDGPFCQLFHVGITPQGIVEDTSYGPDPLCEIRDRFGRL
jgi:hypothetical protein